jgi:hypothetical protein
MLLWAKTWAENKWLLVQCALAATLVLLFFSGAITLWKYIESGPRTWELASLKELVFRLDSLEDRLGATNGSPRGACRRFAHIP